MKRKAALKEIRRIAADIPPIAIDGVSWNHYRRLKDAYDAKGPEGMSDYMEKVKMILRSNRNMRAIKNQKL